MGRNSVVPFARNGRWSVRVPQLNAVPVVKALGVTDRAVAEGIGTFLSWLRGRADYALLDQFVSGEADIRAAYLAWQANKLEAYKADLLAAQQDEDLEPLVAKWVAHMAWRNTPQERSREKYVHQVRQLLPEGERFPKSRFTEATLLEFFQQYGKVSRHYRSAVSSFAEYCVKIAKVLPRNIVMDVAVQAASKPRERYLLPDEAQRLIDALSGEVRAWMALCVATGMEQQSLDNLLRRNINLDDRTIFADASKNDHRARTVYVYWRWDWAWDVFTGWLRDNPRLPNARVFTITQDFATNELRDTAREIGIVDFRPHDFRRTWGVQAAKDKITIQAISHQLGHSNPAITYKVYSKYQATAQDFARPISTIRDTSAETGTHGGGAK